MSRSLSPRGAALLSGLLLLVPSASRAEGGEPPAAGGPDHEPRQGLILGGNLGVPRLGAGDFSLVGDLALGYGASLGGAALSASLEAYDSASSRAVIASRRTAGGLDLWLLPGSGPTRLEVRASGGFAAYTSARLAGETVSAAKAFGETSDMGRLSLSLGLRHEPSERVSFGLWLGGGGQLEWYAAGEVGGAERSGSLGGSVSGLLTAKLRARVGLVPGALDLRLRADADAFGITRDVSTFALDASPTASLENTHATQVDLTTRLLLDASVLSFGGFVPNLHAGLDVFRTSASGLPTASSTVPLVGVGLRRDVD